MQRFSWQKIIRSWWGRSIAGALIGGLLVAFSGIEQPVAFIGGMIVGAVVMFFLGRWE